ncbi:MAG: hypothetical protein LBG71_00575 [Clostridiales Family XIII bacterium]|jgi:hypothetical protein|nr:hypothetical protein [Clostridiales Family XIII bacterium]
MFILGGCYEPKVFLGEEDLKSVKNPRVYGISEFISQVGFEDAISVLFEAQGKSWATASSQEKAIAVEDYFAGNGDIKYFAEAFDSEAAANARLNELERLSEWAANNFIFSHLEAIDGAAIEIWCQPLMDE